MRGEGPGAERRPGEGGGPGVNNGRPRLARMAGSKETKAMCGRGRTGKEEKEDEETEAQLKPQSQHKRVTSRRESQMQDAVKRRLSGTPRDASNKESGSVIKGRLDGSSGTVPASTAGGGRKMKNANVGRHFIH